MERAGQGNTEENVEVFWGVTFALNVLIPVGSHSLGVYLRLPLIPRLQDYHEN